MDEITLQTVNIV